MKMEPFVLLAFFPCKPERLGGGSKTGTSGEGAKGLLNQGSEKPLAPVQQNRVAHGASDSW